MIRMNWHFDSLHMNICRSHLSDAVWRRKLFKYPYIKIWASLFRKTNEDARRQSFYFRKVLYKLKSTYLKIFFKWIRVINIVRYVSDTLYILYQNFEICFCNGRLQNLDHLLQQLVLYNTILCLILNCMLNFKLLSKLDYFH